MLEVAEQLRGVQILIARNRILNNELELKIVYYNKVILRTSREKWRFIRDFNCLVSVELNAVSAIVLIQKSLIDR